MTHRLLSFFWKRFAGKLQWWLLWLVHDKFMVGVAGVVRDADGRVLLLRHRFWKSYGWGLPSGYMERGETPEEALAREIREETGYEIKDVKPLRLAGGFKTRIEVYFEAKIAGGTRAIDGKEVITAAFFRPDALPEELLPSQRAAIAEALTLSPWP